MTERTASLLSGLRAILNNAVSYDVVIGHLTDKQSKVVGLVPYPVQSDAFTGTSIDAVQVLIRGAPNEGLQDSLEVQDQIYNIIAYLENTSIGGVPITLAWRQISAPPRPDGSGRAEIRDSYYLRTDRFGIAA